MRISLTFSLLASVLLFSLSPGLAQAQLGPADQARQVQDAPLAAQPVVPVPDASSRCGSPDEPGYAACVQAGQSVKADDLLRQVEQQQDKANRFNQTETKALKAGLIFPAVCVVILFLLAIFFFRRR